MSCCVCVEKRKKDGQRDVGGVVDLFVVVVRRRLAVGVKEGRSDPAQGERWD